MGQLEIEKEQFVKQEDNKEKLNKENILRRECVIIYVKRIRGIE